MYADTITKSMQKTIDETNYRREKQIAYNNKHNKTPQALNKSLDNALSKNSVATYVQERETRKAAEAEHRYQTPEEIEQKIREIRKAMEKAAKELDFIQAAHLRDEIHNLQKQLTT
jgi:excinuclease ABC subunit B